MKKFLLILAVSVLAVACNDSTMTQPQNQEQPTSDVQIEQTIPVETVEEEVIEITPIDPSTTDSKTEEATKKTN